MKDYTSASEIYVMQFRFNSTPFLQGMILFNLGQSERYHNYSHCFTSIQTVILNQIEVTVKELVLFNNTVSKL